MGLASSESITSSVDPHSNSSSTAARVVGPTSTEPGFAMDCKAAAIVTTSPTAP